jgi:hypothetical protein
MPALNWKTTTKRPLGRSRYKLDDNIKIDLEELSRQSVDWAHLAQDKVQWWAVVSTVINLWIR